MAEQSLWNVEGLEVASWSPGADGEGVPPTQVHLLLKMPGLGLVVVRLKTLTGAKQLIDALVEHRDFVWGGSHDATSGE